MQTQRAQTPAIELPFDNKIEGMKEYDGHFSPKRFNRFPRFSQVVKGLQGQE